MNPLFVLVAVTAVGVEAGWEPLPEGGYQYTIQIEPELVARLQSGSDLVSDVPSHVDVRSFRVTLGSGALARIDSAPAGGAAAVVDDRTRPEGDDAVAAQAGPAIAPGADDAGSVPASFEQSPGGAQPLGDDAPRVADEPLPHSAEKPRLDAQPGEPGGDEPWIPFLVAVGLLAVSLGTNFFLGWVAWGARNRYRDAISKFGGAATT